MYQKLPTRPLASLMHWTRICYATSLIGLMPLAAASTMMIFGSISLAIIYAIAFLTTGRLNAPIFSLPSDVLLGIAIQFMWATSQGLFVIFLLILAFIAQFNLRLLALVFAMPALLVIVFVAWMYGLYTSPDDVRDVVSLIANFHDKAGIVTDYFSKFTDETLTHTDAIVIVTALAWSEILSITIYAFIVLATLQFLVSLFRSGAAQSYQGKPSPLFSLIKSSKRRAKFTKNLQSRARGRALLSRLLAILMFLFGYILLVVCIGLTVAVIASLFGGEQPNFTEEENNAVLKTMSGELSEETRDQIVAMIRTGKFGSITTLISLYAIAMTLFFILPLLVVRWFRNGAAIRAWMKARSLKRPSAKLILESDVRAPAVLLRSFADDDTEIKADNLISGLMRPRIRLEEVIASVMRGFGPVVAVGQPNEPTPRLGGDRDYFQGETWRDGVVRWISLAQTIVVVAGRSPGLLWEIDQIIRSDALSKLIIAFPISSINNKIDTWRYLVNHFPALHATLPELPSGNILLIDLRPSRPLLLEGRSNRVADYESAFILASEMYDRNAPA